MFAKSITGVLVFVLFACSNTYSQNHRQFANWFCGDFVIYQNTSKGDLEIGKCTTINLSPIDSPSYWLVENFSVGNMNSQRLLKITQADSGFLAVDVYQTTMLAKNLTLSIINKYKSTQLKKINQLPFIFYYNRSDRGFLLLKSEKSEFLLEKYHWTINCCNDFSKTYFESLKEKATLKFVKKED